MSQGFLVPAQPIRTEIVVDKSRFLTTVSIAPTVTEARATIAGTRRELPLADHHVYAFRVGHGNTVTEGMSDDGEPSGTAGPPTLAVLRGSNIGDIVMVTSRFFGGIKLGTGGLVRAYTSSAKEALLHLKTELKVEKCVLGLDLPYSLYQIVKLTVAEFGGEIQDEEFGARVLVIAQFVASDAPAFASALQDRTAGRVEPVPLS